MERDQIIRVGFFFGIFTGVAIWESLAPRRKPTTSKKSRWLANFVLVGLNPVSVRLIFPLLPAGMALLAEDRRWGLLTNLPVAYWVKVAAAIVALDFAVYLQHVLHHAIPILWRLHMVHHADLDFDVTTGVRFHPIEIVLSVGIKLGAVAALGPPALAVLIFEVALNATAMFNHSNICLPAKVDRVLRLFLVTPDMHRVHHSVVIKETNSNFGFNFPWWDRLLGTYRDQPAKGHEDMTIGLPHLRDPNRLTLPWLLALPFVENLGAVPINRH